VAKCKAVANRLLQTYDNVSYQPDARLRVLLKQYRQDVVLKMEAMSSWRATTNILDCFLNKRIQFDTSIRELRDNSPAHPRVPEFQYVIFDARNRGLGLLRLEETTDLVGHIG
jgi:hypothetical protein